MEPSRLIPEYLVGSCVWYYFKKGMRHQETKSHSQTPSRGLKGGLGTRLQETVTLLPLSTGLPIICQKLFFEQETDCHLIWGYFQAFSASSRITCSMQFLARKFLVFKRAVKSWRQGRPSLVPRLPCSGTQTLKLCRRGEPGIFSHVRSGKVERR